MRILVKLPTRERPDRASLTIDRLVQLSSGQHEIKILLSLDKDDHTLDFWDTYQIPSGRDHCRLRLVRGYSKSKIDAVNRDMPVLGCYSLDDEGEAEIVDWSQWDIVILMSDDMLPRVKDWDNIIVTDMLREFPNLDGALWYNDGHRAKVLCTLPIMGRNLYDKFGYIYHPDYKSLWCDNEYQRVLTDLGRLVYFEQVIIEHMHFTVDKETYWDDLYQRNEALYRRDQRVYQRREDRDFEREPMLLSILVCSLREREKMRQGLMGALNMQVNRNDYRMRIEILLDVDSGELTIGAKRNKLLAQARGEYIVFIDDDDMVDSRYIDKITTAILDNPGTDCIGIEGQITINGSKPRLFIHSHTILEWNEENEGGEIVYYRSPNHWNPIKREHALAAGFPDVSWGEDHEYSRRLVKLGLLKEEVFIHGPIYFYLFNEKTSKADKTRGVA